MALAPLLLLYSAIQQITSTKRTTLNSLYTRPASPPQSDDELAVSDYRISSIDMSELPESRANEPPTCMPTVIRANGSVEYVSNAVKSWFLAFDATPPPLVVYDLSPTPSTFQWRQSVSDASASAWLTTARLPPGTSEKTRFTLNDSAARVAWRSKEAKDYASVLRACANLAQQRGATSEDLVLIVQDDVLFHPTIADARQWASKEMKLGARSRRTRRGHIIPQRVCSAALFDISGVGDAPLDQSNLVARYWRIGDIEAAAKYFDRHFADKPVDWLADDFCRKRHAVVVVHRPNPVRHRGRVSSFSENKRDNLLT